MPTGSDSDMELVLETTVRQRETGSPWPAKLKRLRAKFGLSQRDAATRIGAARRTWMGWENGYRDPSTSARELLRREFGIS